MVEPLLLDILWVRLVHGQIATLLHEMNHRGKRFGVVSMCIGTGAGAAAVLEVEQRTSSL